MYNVHINLNITYFSLFVRELTEFLLLSLVVVEISSKAICGAFFDESLYALPPPTKCTFG